MWCIASPSPWLFLCFILVLPRPGQAEPFDFVALGDTAYNVPEDYPAYEALIDTINAAEPAFSVHVGDIFGTERCTDALYQHHMKFFQRFNHPLIYTPGDNEWVDCHFTEPAMRNSETGAFDLNAYLAGAGGEIGRERLATLRKTFFNQPKSLGARPMPVTRQGDGEAYPDMVENARWAYGDVMFATVHISGSRNNLNIVSEDASAEAVQRNRANMAWIDQTFAEAKSQNSIALVIIFHADMFDVVRAGDEGVPPVSPYQLIGGTSGPYYMIAGRLAFRATNFDGQVLLIHGDGHRFIVDRPLTIGQGETEPPKRPNVTRLQVFGAPEIKAVRVTVDTDTPWVFSFAPLYN